MVMASGPLVTAIPAMFAALVHAVAAPMAVAVAMSVMAATEHNGKSGNGGNDEIDVRLQSAHVLKLEDRGLHQFTQLAVGER